MKLLIGKNIIDRQQGHNPLEIGITGFGGDPTTLDPVQVAIEVYEGELMVHVFDGSCESPQTIRIPKSIDT